MKSRSEMSSNNSFTSAGHLAKSMAMNVSYSFLPNSLATVDLPTRRAPFIRRAVCPLLSFFHSTSFLYIFRSNIIIHSVLWLQNYNIWLKSQNVFLLKWLKSQFFIMTEVAEISIFITFACQNVRWIHNDLTYV